MHHGGVLKPDPTSRRVPLAAVAVCLLIAGCSGGSTPVGPPGAGSPNQRVLLAGCPSGKVLAARSVRGVAIRLLDSHERDYAICLTLPNGKTVHPGPDDGQLGGYGVYIEPFTGGGYLRVDSLGHVFAAIYPGMIPGITVVVPDGNATRLLGPFPGTSIAKGSEPFVLDQETNDCQPSCAEGHLTRQLLHWSAAEKDYE